ncbi:putative T-cell receptor alpha chain V region CTL-F3 protein [Naja naja]|nr:putative T-cell receptor alpha chain V region CTL-F3 protein [Naja naja]
MKLPQPADEMSSPPSFLCFHPTTETWYSYINRFDFCGTAVFDTATALLAPQSVKEVSWEALQEILNYGEDINHLTNQQQLPQQRGWNPGNKPQQFSEVQIICLSCKGNHLKPACRFRSAICLNCQCKGHIARVCKSGKKCHKCSLSLKLGGSKGQSVQQTSGILTVTEGEPFFLNCSYEAKFSDTYFTFWYVQSPGQSLRFLLAYYWNNSEGF